MDLEGYRLEKRGPVSAYVLSGAADEVSAALFDGQACVETRDVGRAAVQFFPVGSGEGVLRYFRRGGWMSRFVHEWFVGNRMLREFALLRAYREAGGMAPEPLGVSWEQWGPCYRGAIATRRILGETLLEFVRHAEPESLEAVLDRVGACIAHMHAQGFWHADLQLKNILIADDQVWLIDFDKARRFSRLGRIRRARNLLRLRRSFEKHGCSLDNLATLQRGYGALSIPRWLDWAYRLRSARGRLLGA